MAKNKYSLKERISYHKNRLDSNFVERVLHKNPKLFYSEGFVDYMDKVRHGDSDYDGKSRRAFLARQHGDGLANSWFFGFKNAKKAFARSQKKDSSKSKKSVTKSHKAVRRSGNQKYTSLMHGRRMKTKKRRPIIEDDFIRDSHGRIKGTYLDGFFIPD